MHIYRVHPMYTLTLTVSKKNYVETHYIFELRRRQRRSSAGGVRSSLGITFNETRSFRV